MIKNNKLITALLASAMTVSSFGIMPAFAEDSVKAEETAVTSTNSGSLVIEGSVLKDAQNVSGEVVIPDTVTSIKKGAFEGNTKITKLVIPGSIKNIDECTFSYMSGLTDVEIKEGVTTIGSSAFALCSKLASVKLPSSLKNLKNGAFGACTSLKEVVVPEGITKLEGNTFSGCTSLEKITLPSTLNRVGLHDFYLTPWVKAAADKDGFVIVNNILIQYTNTDVLDVKVPDGVKTIGAGALGFCNIKTVVLPDSVELIQDSAFMKDTALESIKLSSNLKAIESFAFTNCDALKTAEIPASVTKLEDNSFDENIELTGDKEKIYELIKECHTTADKNFAFGWVRIGSDWYYRNPVAKDSAKVRGYTQTGWLYNNGSWYYFDSIGRMLKGFVTPKGEDNTYYLEDSTLDTVGIMRTGWLNIDGNWYYFNTKNEKNEGAMAKGWRNINGTWYYFYYGDGKMAANTWIDGYHVNASGAWDR